MYWLRAIAARPTAFDILSNLGYAYSEANDLEHAENYLKRAVELRPTQSRPHNNLGRVLLRRSTQSEAAARVADAMDRPEQRDVAVKMRAAAKKELDAAIEQFKKAVELDPSLFEPRLNLGEIYMQLKELDKAEAQYRAMLMFESQKAKTSDDKANFSQAYYGLARIAVARKQSDDAICDLKKAIELNPRSRRAMELLARQRYQRGDEGKHEVAARAREDAKLPAEKP